MSDSKKGYRLVLKQKQYCKLIIANLINRFGDSVDSLAFAWLVYALTNDAAWSAIIFGVNRLPSIFLQPIGGAIVENKNKKSIIVLTDIIRGVCVGLIALFYFLGILQPWMLVITTLIISSVEAFGLPASSAVVYNIIDKETLEFGLSLNSSLSSIVELIGLGVAGLIIAKLSISGAIGIDAFTFFLSAIIKLTVNTNEKKYEKKIESTKVKIEGYLNDLKDGIKYVRTKKAVFNIIIMTVLVNAMLVPFNSLQAPLISEVLHSEEGMLSVLGTAITLGMLIGAVIYPYLANKLSDKFFTAIGGASFGIYYVALVVIGNYISNSNKFLYNSIVAVISFIAGIFITFTMQFIAVVFMKVIEKEYIARANSIVSSAAVSATPVTSFLLSFIVAFTSTKTIFLVSGVILIVLMIALSFLFRFDDQDVEKNNENTELKNQSNEQDTDIESTLEPNIDGELLTQSNDGIMTEN